MNKRNLVVFASLAVLMVASLVLAGCSGCFGTYCNSPPPPPPGPDPCDAGSPEAAADAFAEAGYNSVECENACWSCGNFDPVEQDACADACP